MGSSAALETQKKPSATFATQLLENDQRPAADRRAQDRHEQTAMHDFGDVSLNSTRTQTCPLAAPRSCPFGGACHTCPTRVQAKLEVGQPDDEYEREADEVADKVMRMPEPCCSGRPDGDDKDEIRLKSQSSASVGMEVSPEVEAQIQSFRTSVGRPLSSYERAFFEPRFGHDFSEVRIHEGTLPAEAAHAVSAKAFAVGEDVVFGVRQHAPTEAGYRLLAHELAHVVRQTGSAVRRQAVDQPEKVACGTEPANASDPRPGRPSDAQTQKDALLAQAMKHSGTTGMCYGSVKDAIKGAGGYGDILDVRADSRFKGYQVSAHQFGDRVSSTPSDFCLEEIDHTKPADFPSGSILVTGQGLGIPSAHGDIAVVEGVKGGLLHVHNYAAIKFSAARWAEYNVIGIFVPVSRPARAK